MPTTGTFPFATAMGMIDRVHGDATGLGTLAQPPVTPGFPNFDVLVIGIPNLADGGTAILQDQPNLA